jgi:hypothetical protein
MLKNYDWEISQKGSTADILAHKGSVKWMLKVVLGVEWIQQAKDEVQCLTFINMLITQLVSQIQGISL